jgi:hypothetical protein
MAAQKWNNVNIRMTDAQLVRLNASMAKSGYTSRHTFLDFLLDMLDSKTPMPVITAQDKQLADANFALQEEMNQYKLDLIALQQENNQLKTDAELLVKSSMETLQHQDPTEDNAGKVILILNDQENAFLKDVCIGMQADPKTLLINKILIQFSSFFPQQLVNVPKVMYDAYKKHFHI